MGKRSEFERVEKDFYRTIDKRAVEALLPFLPYNTAFDEPCAGAGDLFMALEKAGHSCVSAWDIKPNHPDVLQGNALVDDVFSDSADCIITNPPWSRDILHPMIERFVGIKPAWLLFDADWAHTAQSAPYMKYCSDIVSVGRLVWIPGTKTSGKDNCAWYRFSSFAGKTIFHGRIARQT